MAETPDFSSKEALADRYADFLPYDEARLLAELPYEPEGQVETTYTEPTTTTPVTPRYRGQSTVPGDHAYVLSQSLRPSTEVLADPIPAKGNGYLAAQKMAKAIASKDWALVQKLLGEESGGNQQNNKVA